MRASWARRVSRVSKAIRKRRVSRESMVSRVNMKRRVSRES
jgi:hypothetical protein